MGVLDKIYGGIGVTNPHNNNDLACRKQQEKAAMYIKAQTGNSVKIFQATPKKNSQDRKAAFSSLLHLPLTCHLPKTGYGVRGVRVLLKQTKQLKVIYKRQNKN